VAAECLLRLWGALTDKETTEAEFIEVYVGAVLVADALDDLRKIRKALTKRKSG
jgi:hypothetical protein